MRLLDLLNGTVRPTKKNYQAKRRLAKQLEKQVTALQKENSKLGAQVADLLLQNALLKKN